MRRPSWFIEVFLFPINDIGLLHILAAMYIFVNNLIKGTDMNMLGVVFTIGIVVAGGFLLWLYTKSGKKWLNDL